MLRRSSRFPLLAGLGLALTAAIAAPALLQAKPPAATASKPMAEAKTSGYLTPAQLPDSLLLVPPPPAKGSPGRALDEAVNKEALAMRGSPRFALAAQDAQLHFPGAANHFSCPLGIQVSAAHTPHLYQLLLRVAQDAGDAAEKAKAYYHVPRPFMDNGLASCTPADEAALRPNGSYPSGHTSIGWAWAQVLSEADPARTDALMARGRSYGESRMVCNVHWQSDVLASRIVAAATVAKLQDNPQFRADLEGARKEIAAARAQGLTPAKDCAVEAKTLQVRPASAL
ncbi:phosphatase PAP2 family protein [Xanthomonas translucens]|jgi:acid phosphatase (class A)|uniref:acid phosphatase n=1 Tax=Xanthomonas campestris pv. translucens TaxID=343 RepID=UPI001F15EA49|nr:phosphatase PAP2 family protein [Xanthomonas translucens]UKE50933.1 phosphatase PAP2 family protein [Xanthomonas translucens]